MADLSARTTHRPGPQVGLRAELIRTTEARIDQLRERKNVLLAEAEQVEAQESEARQCLHDLRSQGRNT